MALQRFKFALIMMRSRIQSYKTLPGWEQEISGIRNFNDLPQAAQDYILFIEGVLDCPVGIVSVGPSRDQTIYRA